MTSIATLVLIVAIPVLCELDHKGTHITFFANGEIKRCRAGVCEQGKPPWHLRPLAKAALKACYRAQEDE